MQAVRMSGDREQARDVRIAAPRAGRTPCEEDVARRLREELTELRDAGGGLRLDGKRGGEKVGRTAKLFGELALLVAARDATAAAPSCAQGRWRARGAR